MDNRDDPRQVADDRLAAIDQQLAEGCAPFCARMDDVSAIVTIEPTTSYADTHPTLQGAPSRSWIALHVTDVPAMRCSDCGRQMLDVEVDEHVNRLVVAYWDAGAQPGGDLTVSYQPPAGKTWQDLSAEH